MILGCWGCAVCCGIWQQSCPLLTEMPATPPSPAVVTTPNVFRHCQMSPAEQTHPRLRTSATNTREKLQEEELQMEGPVARR